MSSLPRFSVIVPAYKVQAYLHECLDSVLSQSFTDLEVIVVDDASPDNCAAIADEFAARDPRVRRTVRLRENAGPGAARNKGMEYARGDYLLFLDADDTFTPGALQAIADRVKETGEPDVLVHDLRHSFASTAIMDNVPLATIGRLLGHVLPEATAKYAHLSDDVIGDAADRIAGSLAQAIGLRP